MGVLLRLNFDVGGDPLLNIKMSTEETHTLAAGQFGTLSGGIFVHPDEAPWTLEATLGFKANRAVVSNGSVAFVRVPLDLIASWRSGDFRAGIGGTVQIIPSFICDKLCDSSAPFVPAFGAMLQLAYGHRFGINSGIDFGIRLTSINYVTRANDHLTGKPLEVDGSCVGGFFSIWL